jgi:hypothetical protein
MRRSPRDVNQLLADWCQDVRVALEKVASVCYGTLRQLAEPYSFGELRSAKPTELRHARTATAERAWSVDRAWLHNMLLRTGPL